MMQPKRDMTKYRTGNRTGERDGRRAEPGQKKAFEVDHMWEVHHEIVRRRLLGQKVVNIARDLGVSETMVSYTLNSPVVRDKLDVMKGARDAETLDLAKRIRENAPKSLKLLEEIIEGEVDGTTVGVGLRAREANTMLARAGYGPITNVKGAIAHAHFSGEDIKEIKKRAIESGVKSGVVVDADLEEVG